MIVIPAKAGTHFRLDTGTRRYDREGKQLHSSLPHRLFVK